MDGKRKPTAASGAEVCRKKKALLADTAKYAKITDLFKLQVMIRRTVAKRQKHPRGVSREKVLCHSYILCAVN